MEKKSGISGNNIRRSLALLMCSALVLGTVNITSSQVETKAEESTVEVTPDVAAYVDEYLLSSKPEAFYKTEEPGKYAVVDPTGNAQFLLPSYGMSGTVYWDWYEQGKGPTLYTDESKTPVGGQPMATHTYDLNGGKPPLSANHPTAVLYKMTEGTEADITPGTTVTYIAPDSVTGKLQIGVTEDYKYVINDTDAYVEQKGYDYIFYNYEWAYACEKDDGTTVTGLRDYTSDADKAWAAEGDSIWKTKDEINAVLENAEEGDVYYIYKRYCTTGTPRKCFYFAGKKITVDFETDITAQYKVGDGTAQDLSGSAANIISDVYPSQSVELIFTTTEDDIVVQDGDTVISPETVTADPAVGDPAPTPAKKYVVKITGGDKDNPISRSISVSKPGKKSVTYNVTVNYADVEPAVTITNVNGKAYTSGDVYINQITGGGVPITATISAADTPAGLLVSRAELLAGEETTAAAENTKEYEEADRAKTKTETFTVTPTENATTGYTIKGTTTGDGSASASVNIVYDTVAPVLSSAKVDGITAALDSPDTAIKITSTTDTVFSDIVTSDALSGVASVSMYVKAGENRTDLTYNEETEKFVLTKEAAAALYSAGNAKGKTCVAVITAEDNAGNPVTAQINIEFYEEKMEITRVITPEPDVNDLTGGTVTTVVYTIKSDVQLLNAKLNYTQDGTKAAEQTIPVGEGGLVQGDAEEGFPFVYTYTHTLAANASTEYEGIEFYSTNINGVDSATDTIAILKIDLTAPEYTGQYASGDSASSAWDGTWTDGFNAGEWYNTLLLKVIFSDGTDATSSGIDISDALEYEGAVLYNKESETDLISYDDTKKQYTAVFNVSESSYNETLDSVCTVFRLSIEDKKGNKTAEFSQTYHVDATAPEIDQPLKAGEFTEGIITEKDPTITFKAHDNIKVSRTTLSITKPGSADAVDVELKDGSEAPVEDLSQNLSSLLGLDASSDIEIGEYKLQVVVVDQAGNSVSDTITFTLDYLAPVVDIEIGSPASNAPKFEGYHNTYTYDDTAKGTYDYAQYYNADVTMTLSAVDHQIDNTCITAADGTESISGFTESPAGTWKKTYTAETEGEHSISIFATDKGSLQSNTKEVAFVIDKTAPVLDVKLNESNVSAEKVMLKDGENAVISFTVTDTNEDTSDLKKTVSLTLPDGTVQPAETTAVGYSDGKYTDDTYTDEGDYEITYVATDLAGNESTATTVKFRIDHSAPDFIITAEQSETTIGVTASSASGTDYYDLDEKLTDTADAALLVDVSDNIDAADALTVTAVLNNSAASALTGSNTGGNVWTFPITMKDVFGDEDPRGKTYTATISVKDTSGNETVKYVNITFYSEEVKVSSRIAPALVTDEDTNTGSLNIIYTIQADAPVEEASVALKKKTQSDSSTLDSSTLNTPVGKDDLTAVTATDANLPYQYEYTYEISDTESALYTDITFSAKNIHGIQCANADVISIVRVDLDSPEVEDIQWRETEDDPWTTADGNKWYKSLLLQVVYSDKTISSGIDQQSFVDSLSGVSVFDNTISLNADGNKLTAILQVDKSTSEEGTAVSFEVKDNVGNLSQKYENTFYVDMVDPTVDKELYTELQAEEMNGDPKIGYETSDDIRIAKAVLEITLPDGTIKTLSSEDNELIGETLEPTELSKLLEVEEPEDGMYNFHLTVYDLAGRKAESKLSLKLDNTVPVTGIVLQGAYRKLDGKNLITHTDSYDPTGYQYNEFNNREILTFDLYVSKDVQQDKTIVTDSLGSSHLEVGEWTESGDYLHAVATVTGEGIHTLTLKTVDNVGNDSETAEFKIELDNTAPVINLSVDGVVDAEDGLYYKDAATVDFTVTEKNTDDEENALYITKVYTDGSGTKEENVKPIEQGESSFDENAAYTLIYSVRDLAGNTATRTIFFTVDTVDPVVDIIIRDPEIAEKYDKYQTEYKNEVTGKTYTYAQYFNRTVGISAEAYDLLFKEVSVTDNGKQILSYNTEEDGSIQKWSDNYAITEEGEHVIQITAKDIGGREAEVQTVTFYIDTEAPEIATKLNGSDTVEEKVYLDKDGVISVKATDAYMDEDDLLQTVTVTLPGKTAETSESYVAVEGDIIFSDEADYVVYYTATDRAGNFTVGSDITFRVDKTAPEMSITVEQDDKAIGIEDGALVDKVTSTRPVYFYVDVFDNLNEAAESGIDPSTVTLEIGGETVAPVIDGNRCSFTINPEELFGSPRGKTYTAKIQAVDRSGNILEEKVSLTFFTERVVVSHTISPSLKTSTDTNSRQTNVVYTIQSDVPLKNATLTWKKDGSSNTRVIDVSELTVEKATSNEYPYYYTYTLALSDSSSTLYENISLFGTNIYDVSGSNDTVSVIRVDLDNPTWSASVPDTEEWFQSLVIQIEITDGNPSTSSGLVTETFYSSLSGATASGGGSGGVNSFSVTIVVNPSQNEKGTPVYFRIEDVVGNISNTFNRTYYVDDTDPVINSFYVDGKQGEEKINGDPTIVYKSTDNIRIGEVTMEITGPDFKKTISSETDSRLKGTGASLTLSQLLGVTEDELKDGTYTLKLDVFDLSKRTDTNTISFKLDNTTPDTGITLRESYRNADGKYPVTHIDWINKDGYIYNRYINRDSAVFDLYVSEDVPSKNIIVKDSAGSGYLSVSSWTKDGSGYQHAVATVTGEGMDHVLSLGAKDDVGNDTQMISFEFTLDTTPPAISLKVNGRSDYEEGRYYSEAVKVDFSVADRNKDNEENSLVITKVYNDGSGTVTETVDDLAEGSLVFDEDARYTLDYSAKDKAGNISHKTTAFIIDKVNPVVDLVIRDPMNAPKAQSFKNTYRNNISGKTYEYANYFNRNVTVDLNVTDDTVYSVSVYDNGSLVRSKTIDLESNNVRGWSDNYTASSEGEHVIRINAADRAGRTAAEQTVSFVIDRTAPVVSTSLNGNTFSEGAPTQYLSMNGVIGVSVADANKDDGDLTRILRISPPGRGTAVTTEHFQEGNTTYSEEADYEVTFTAVDRAGNESAARTVTFRVDMTAPVLNITSDAYDGVSKTEVIVTYNVIEAFYADMELAKVTVYKKVDGSAEQLLRTDDFRATGQNSSMQLKLEEDGNYRFVFDARDRTGNTATTNYTVMLDKNAPVIILDGVANYDKTKQDVTLGIKITETFYLTNKVDVSGTRTDIEGTKDKLVFDQMDFSKINKASEADLEQTFREDGVYDILIKSTDQAGNVTDKDVNFTIDKTPPVIGDLSKYDGKRLREFVWDIDEQKLVTDLTACEVTVYLDGVVYDGITVPADGSHILRVVAKDELGNESSKEVTFVLDTIKPNFIITGIENNQKIEEPATIHVSLQLDEDTLDSVTLNGVEQSLAGNQAVIVIDETGSYTLVAKAHDEAGNVAELTWNFSYGKAGSLLWVIIAGAAAVLLLGVLILIRAKSWKQKK